MGKRQLVRCGLIELGRHNVTKKKDGPGRTACAEFYVTRRPDDMHKVRSATAFYNVMTFAFLRMLRDASLPAAYQEKSIVLEKTDYVDQS